VNGRKILVTGCSSFIGRRVVARHTGPDLVAHTRRPVVAADASVCEWVAGDLADADFYRSPVLADVGAVIHLAATSPSPGISTEKIVRDNVGGAVALFAWAASHAVPIVFASSLSLHGEIRGGVADQRTGSINPDAYGATKLICEQLLAADAAHFPSVSIRLPGVIGEGATRIWFERTIAKLRAGGDVEIHNPDAPFNNMIHVDDLADFMVSLARAPIVGAMRFPIGAADPLPIARIVRMLADALGSTSRIVERTSPNSPFLIDNSGAVAAGYRPASVSALIQRRLKEITNAAAT